MKKLALFQEINIPNAEGEDAIKLKVKMQLKAKPQTIHFNRQITFKSLFNFIQPKYSIKFIVLIE